VLITQQNQKYESTCSKGKEPRKEAVKRPIGSVVKKSSKKKPSRKREYTNEEMKLLWY
jgi:hypothetical protein